MLKPIIGILGGGQLGMMLCDAAKKIGLETHTFCPDDEFLQLATMKMPLGMTFKPHKHIYKDGPKEVIAQESWIVIEGKVKVILYDIDDTIIHEDVIFPGDCSITFKGGHNYEILEDDTIVYEYKTGPYQGIEMDKDFI